MKQLIFFGFEFSNFLATVSPDFEFFFGPPFYEITARSGEDTAKLRWPKLFFSI